MFFTAKAMRNYDKYKDVRQCGPINFVFFKGRVRAVCQKCRREIDVKNIFMKNSFFRHNVDVVFGA